ncbi:hypothetical protein MASR2M47_17060 [Draconibacterium sp.]|jgi:uncharacterized surface protein with fasciclin (FAS1) repeats
MKLRLGILFIGILIIAAFGCTKQWDEHYTVYPETVDENVWDVIQSDPQFSSFVQIIKAAKMDTLFLSDIAYTIFAPTNEAISNFQGVKEFSNVVLAYHLSSHFINISSIQGKRQVQTLTEKFAMFERNGNEVKIDEIKVVGESPLYRNGKFFTMEKVIEPRPNLYEYYQFTNPVLSNYIDTQDTIILDKEKSKPLGFDDDGNTVYDTVSIIANKFEMKYFPVKEEFRNLTSTIVFPKEDDYRGALNIMALSLGGEYNDYNDIPLDWQEEILIPHILSQGVFLNRLEPEEFVWKSPKDTLKLLNVLGDSVVINYVPTDKALCSNGYAYNYQSYEIPDSLYNGGTKFEGEALVNPTGLNKYAWIDSVSAKSDISLVPMQELIQGASNDSIIRVNFPKGYKGKFTLDFKSPKLFPRKYVMAISTHMDIGGIYDIYVNNVLVKTFDYYAYIQGRGVIFSVTGERYIPRGRFNKFDMYVDNIEEYGSAKIRIDYKGPGFVASNGLVIDYIEFIPVTE